MKASVAVFTAALLAGCAAGAGSGPYAAGDAGRQNDLASAEGSADRCFFGRTVSSFSPAGRDAVNVRVGLDRVYRLEVAGCPDLDFSLALALRSRNGADTICGAHDADLVVPGPGGRQTCSVTNVRALSPTEVAALSPRERP